MAWKTIRTVAAQAAESASPPSAGIFVSPDATPKPGDIAGEDFSTDGPRHPYLEIAFDSLVLHGTPTSVTFGVWRSSESSIDKMALVTVASADIGDPIPVIVDFHGESVWVTVESFVAGSSPNIDGSIRVRPVRL